MPNDPAIEYTLSAEQDDIPVRGNALASGDDAFDKKTEDEILRRLDRGDIWAWASVKVEARLTIDDETFIGTDYLCGCSYADENDFKAEGGYYDDMKERAREDLIESVKAAVKRGEVAKQVLVALTKNT